MRALDATGAAWGAPVIPDPQIGGGLYTCLSEVNGAPAIAHFNGWTSTLLFERALDPLGAAWAPPVSVLPAGTVVSFPAIGYIGGNLFMSLFSEADGALELSYAGDPDGGSWQPPAALDTVGESGEWTSYRVINGFPALCYFDRLNEDLRYAICF